MTREFHITDILSITSGRLLSTRLMDGVYDILEYMTGDRIFTHQVSHARNACAAALLAQHPYLESGDVLDVDEENIARRVKNWISLFGETLPVEKLSGGLHDFSDPMADLAETVHPDRIFQIDLEQFPIALAGRPDHDRST